MKVVIAWMGAPASQVADYLDHIKRLDGSCEFKGISSYDYNTGRSEIHYSASSFVEIKGLIKCIQEFVIGRATAFRVLVDGKDLIEMALDVLEENRIQVARQERVMADNRQRHEEALRKAGIAIGGHPASSDGPGYMG